jgi:AbrB family looped-hinge helix DNA binding protein
MASESKIQRNFQVTIPAEIRKRAHLEVGDLVEFELREDGILMKPMQIIEKSQAWFWSPEWQEQERLVEDDIRKGKLKVSESVEGFLEELDR